MQRLVAFGLLVAGVVVLFGVGWGLVAGGLLLWVRDDRAAAWLARQGDLLLIRVAAGRHRLREAPRRTVAAWTMGAGVATAPPGALLIGGLGVALIVAAALLVGVSLLLGWGT